MSTEVRPWIAVQVVIAGALGAFQPAARGARARGVVCVTALACNAGVWSLRGSQDGLEWINGYLVEEVFVFFVLFTYFAARGPLGAEGSEAGIPGGGNSCFRR
jgi:hypothetical protein